MTFKEIALKVIADLEKSNTQITPDLYKQNLCKELAANKIALPDCEQLQKAISKLSSEYQQAIKKYPIKTIEDLNSFLIAQVNRLSPSDADAHISLLLRICATICDTVVKLKNKNATILATTTKDRIENSKNTDYLLSIKKEWETFSATFNDKQFDDLKPYGVLHTETWDSIVLDIKKAFEESNDFTILIDAIIKSLQPSFSKRLAGEIAHFAQKAYTNPNNIKNKDFIEIFKTLINKRFELDQQELQNSLKELDATIEVIANALNNAERAGIGGGHHIGSLKTMISSADNSNFLTLKHKMLELATTIEQDIKNVTSLVKDESAQLEKMQKQISDLEQKLEETKKDASMDFLTKLLNRKVLEETLNNLENDFLQNSTNYSIVFFDIDHFKKINDEYGHLAGDSILAAFAAILKRRAQNHSYVGRWGGEEFVMALPNKDITDAYALAEQIRKTIMQTKFVYKNTQINVTTSCGVSDRNNCENLKHTIKTADEYLYVAKRNGRNKVEPTI